MEEHHLLIQKIFIECLAHVQILGTISHLDFTWPGWTWVDSCLDRGSEHSHVFLGCVYCMLFMCQAFYIGDPFKGTMRGRYHCSRLTGK